MIIQRRINNVVLIPLLFLSYFSSSYVYQHANNLFNSWIRPIGRGKVDPNSFDFNIDAREYNRNVLITYTDELIPLFEIVASNINQTYLSGFLTLGLIFAFVWFISLTGTQEEEQVVDQKLARELI